MLQLGLITLFIVGFSRAIPIPAAQEAIPRHPVHPFPFGYYPYYPFGFPYNYHGFPFDYRHPHIPSIPHQPQPHPGVPTHPPAPAAPAAPVAPEIPPAPPVPEAPPVPAAPDAPAAPAPHPGVPTHPPGLKAPGVNFLAPEGRQADIPVAQMTFREEFKGQCKGLKDGLYYVDARSFAYCIGGVHYYESCPLGSINPALKDFKDGTYGDYAHFCKINVAAEGV